MIREEGRTAPFGGNADTGWLASTVKRHLQRGPQPRRSPGREQAARTEAHASETLPTRTLGHDTTRAVPSREAARDHRPPLRPKEQPNPRICSFWSTNATTTASRAGVEPPSARPCGTSAPAPFPSLSLS